MAVTLIETSFLWALFNTVLNTKILDKQLIIYIVFIANIWVSFKVLVILKIAHTQGLWCSGCSTR